MFKLLAIPVFAFLDRWGGGGFEFLGIKQWPLNRGWKTARRIGIPLLVWALNPCVPQFIMSLVMGAILTFDLDEIKRRDFETVFLYGLGLGAAIFPMAGLWSLLVPAEWLLGVYLSNIGLGKWRLGWHWVEVFRGVAIGAAIFFGR